MKSNPSLYSASKFFSFYILCFLFNTSIAQVAQDGTVNFQTPNTASLGLYTQVPVSPFTGTPNIEIPIYEITEGGITVPISMTYHPSSVRVHSHPGWVGLGWSLQTSGAITRVVNGQLDEWKGKSGHFHSTVETGFYSSYSTLAGGDSEWISSTRLQQYASNYVPTIYSPRYESMPDEFSFNFLGYSGKFFMGHDGQWKVVCDQEIKVEFDPQIGQGFIQESGLRSQIIDRINAYGDNNSKSVWSNRYFNKFTLVTPDGARYEFGGVNATEYNLPYIAQGSAGPIPVTWYLTKITTPVGSEITYNYQPGNLITAITSRFYHSSTKTNIHRSIFSLDANCNVTQNIHESEYDGTVMFPVYLQSISFPRGSVFFDISPSIELRWPSDAQVDADLNPSPNNNLRRAIPVYFEPTYQAPNNYTNYGEQRKWYKLDRIRINEYAYQGYPGTKVFKLSYSDNAHQRLKLLSIHEESNGVAGGLKKLPPYVFYYNPLNLPSYSQLKSNDHWDFYNGYNPADFLAGGGSVAVRAQKFYNAREPDPTGVYMKSEILERIQYPTGGLVKFEYEPHTFSKYVDRENPSFPVNNLGKSKNSGGLRIKRILHFTINSDGDASLIKEYFYLNNFSLSADRDALSSSGILGGYPKYYWPNYVGRFISGATYTASVFSSGTVLPFGYNTPGSHIGYSEVVEVSKFSDGTTNGYTKFKFSNFDTDIWGQSHPDEIGSTPDPQRSVYSPYTTNELQRGKLLVEDIYSNSDQPIRTTKFKYTIASNGYVRRVLQEPAYECGYTSAGLQICHVTAFKTYIHRYNLERKEVTEYDGSKSFTTTTNYEYTPQNFLSRSWYNTSDGGTIEKRIRYPLDFITVNNIQASDWEAIGISKLIQKNILNAPIEIQTRKNGQLRSAAVVGYKVYSNNVFPHKKWEIESGSLLPIGPIISKTAGLDTDKFNPSGLYLDNGQYYFRRDEHFGTKPIVFDQYDDKGNFQEVIGSDGIVKSYIWGYKKALPIAEIIGATFSQVSSLVNIPDLTTSLQSNASMWNAFAALRNGLPNALVTGYTYSAFGMTSKVDVSGQKTYYEYDSLGRLISIKDNEGKVVQAFDYHFSDQN